MAQLHIFVPENDTALAAGEHNARFTPPRAAWDLHLAGEALPMWYGRPNDRFLSYGLNAEWFDAIEKGFATGVEPTSEVAPGDVLRPWGWSEYTRQLYRDFGVEASCLPTDEHLRQLRELSHRQSSVIILNRLREALPGVPLAGDVRQVQDVAEVASLVDAWGDCMLKQPWSSSGRGVIDTSRISPEKILQQASGIIKRQGSVMVERKLNRVVDFAMLFESAGGTVRFIGHSVFATSPGGDYEGNIVAGEDELRGHIERYIPAQELAQVSEALCAVLASYLGDVYDGLLGVDMMVCATDDGRYILAPCVELNLRTTMGHVAHAFGERYLAPGITARLTVEPLTVPVPANYTGDCTVEGGRLAAGTVLLSPPGRFALKVTTGEQQ